MMPALLIAVLVLGACAAWAAQRINPGSSRWVALIVITLGLLILAFLAFGVQQTQHLPAGNVGNWLADFKLPWLSRFGISFHLAVDGLSLMLIALTLLLGLMAIGSSWDEIRQRQGFFYFNLLFCLAGVVGVFLALDLFLFFFFWEVMIIPMFFLISIWGHEDRFTAAVKFFIFTQASGLLMLLSIIVLAIAHKNQTGNYSFDYFDLLGLSLDSKTAFWLMLGFFTAFTVKLPSLPFHVWLPDAHTQAPTGGSVILAGIMLKTGAYGLIRFAIPLFPEAAHEFAPVAMILGTASVLYAAMMAFAQTDLKRLIAYTSVSHMGFVTLGVFSGKVLALQGAVITMLAHGISASALFMIAGSLQERLHTRELNKMGGLWAFAPALSATALFFAIATLGLPGLGNFVGEFLVLLGVYKTYPVLAIITLLVLILAPVYALSLIQRAFHGARDYQLKILDASRRELACYGVLILSTLWLGLHPQPVFDTASPALSQPQTKTLAGKSADV